LALGATGDARSEFDKAIRNHVSRVVSFGTSTDAAAVAPTTAVTDAYVAKWLARYDAAADAEAKLNVVMKQLWFSSFGNGFEIYHTYRRTGYPNTIDDLRNPSPKGVTSYIWRLPYPNAELNLNGSITTEQKAYKYWINKVFWIK
jgi:Susd and RagB outer membrane lipoprotein